MSDAVTSSGGFRNQTAASARRPWARLLAALVGVLAIAAALTMLLRAEAPLERIEIDVSGTPATLTVAPSATDAPLVVIAHGFAGSRQFMEAFSLTLARSGYAALAFDFMGHGRNPVPMGGDVNSIDGTTRLLMDETARVIAAGLARPEVGGQGVVLLGHSMATDVITREALRNDQVRAVVGISMYSQAVTATEPQRLLIVSGSWEPHLREFGVDALRMVNPEAGEGQTVQSGEIIRRAVAAPRSEHVGVLYSATTLEETRDFIDATYGRTSDGPILRHGPWVALLLGGIVVLGWPLLTLVPSGGASPALPGWKAVLISSLVPALAVPPVMTYFDTSILPVLVADYLALHLAAYGALQLAILWRMGYAIPRGPIWPALLIVAWGIGAFGLALDRFGAAFVPYETRWGIIAAVAVGAVLYMLGDAVATAGGRAPLLRRIVTRTLFLASLGLAVTFDFDGLFFLVMILPIIVLFYLVYGTMGGWVGRRAGPLAAGLGLGICLAWAMGVSFPLFAGSGV